MSDYIFVITTIDKKEKAQAIARTLVERRLAACVQILPIASTYRWKGEIEEAQEWMCICKTRRAVFEDVELAIKELHSYETPEIVAIPIEAGGAEYLSWLDQEVK